MNTKDRTYKFNNSTVTIKFGDIVSSKAEIIVSSDDTLLTMSGGVSHTIKKAAGHVTFFADSTDKAAPWSIKQTSVKEIPTTVVCQPRGGFIFVINP